MADPSSQGFSSSSMPRQDELRTPPHNDEAERSLLGAIFLENRVFDEVLAIVQAEDLYREAHRHIYRAMAALHARNDAIDVITVADYLNAEKLLEAVGGPNMLARLSSEIPSAANVSYYATIISRKASLRNFITTAHALIDECYNDVTDFEAFMDTAESKLFAITQSGAKKGYVTMREVIKEAFAQIEALYQKAEQVTGVPSGFIDLDEITAGWQPSDLIILAARPAMGKTAMTLNMAAHAAIERKVPVAFFSLEMSNVQLAIRMLCSEARIDQSKLRTGRMTEQEWARLIKAAGTLSESPIFLDDTPALPIMEFRSKARLLKAEHDIGIIFVDYLQLMKAAGRSIGSREQEISEISRNLKGIAKELQVPVVALAQLNRGVESRADKRPMNSDLRECVTGDTLVHLADGRRVPIAELVGEQPEVWAVDEKGGLVRAQSDKVWEVGERDVFEVKLATGPVLRATESHRVLTDQGWKKISELQDTTRLALSLSQQREMAATSDLYWDKVVSVERAGRELVYDLTVPGPASWLANEGLVSHNSGAIEQDADIISFIYRDEVYNPESEHKGLAEFILGKHRNGGLGTVRLRFFGQYTRFENLAPEMAEAIGPAPTP